MSLAYSISKYKKTGKEKVEWGIERVGIKEGTIRKIGMPNKILICFIVLYTTFYNSHDDN